MNIYLYGHGGSDNHGCEALVRSTCEVLKKHNPRISLYSQRKIKDEKYGVDECVFNVAQYHRYFKEKTLPYLINYIFRYGFNCNTYYYYYANNALLKKIDKEGIYLSIGGDNYCYGTYYKNLGYINKKISSKAKTVLWGVSIEPDIINISTVTEDLKRYSLIIARESITYNALNKAGICINTYLIPDTAFVLPAIYRDLPKGFLEDKTIGINLSPLVQKLRDDNDITYNNYKELIDHIITKTDNNIALIPHVVEDNNDDLVPLTRLYKEFAHTGRIVLINDHNCMELKGFIARCRMFIGARTHSTIAAYSSCVPAIALGYSVKAKGIAQDIFGQYENYVVSVSELKNESQLKEAFIWLSENECDIRKHLKSFMPEYISRVHTAEELIGGLFQKAGDV